MEAESVLGRRAAQVLGVLVLFVVVVGVLLAILTWYIAPSGAEQKQALVVTLAQILGGTALLSGLYFTWRTLQVNREGQITERFTRAIDQLGATDAGGNKLFEIRLGGIYALERIARESELDYWPIMEVLTAYVRQHARRLPEEAQLGEADTAMVVVETESAKVDALNLTIEEVKNLMSAPAPDIQAVMTVIRRRTRYFGPGGEPASLDLRKANLSGADLSGANLLKADLSGADLSGADLSGAYVRSTNFHEANLSVTMLHKANLFHAVLRDANCRYAVLQEANLSRANLSGATLYRANLSGADLSGADLSKAKHLTQEQLAKTRIGDEYTLLPPTLKLPAHWSVMSNGQREKD